MIRSEADITMCLKQNPKIKRWKEETVKKGDWEDYGEDYRIASQDFTLAETGKPLKTGNVCCPLSERVFLAIRITS
jgi:hypothetical protein